MFLRGILSLVTAFAPSRGRELKYICVGFHGFFCVRPLAGAGIEMKSLVRRL